MPDGRNHRVLLLLCPVVGGRYITSGRPAETAPVSMLPATITYREKLAVPTFPRAYGVISICESLDGARTAVTRRVRGEAPHLHVRHARRQGGGRNKFATVIVVGQRQGF